MQYHLNDCRLVSRIAATLGPASSLRPRHALFLLKSKLEIPFESLISSVNAAESSARNSLARRML